jgi:hypothetical protein
MFFGEEDKANKEKEGRWSTPASVSFGERIQDQIIARASFGSGSESIESYKQAAKETAGKMLEKGQYVASGAYSKAREAKHAALDWITSFTSSSTNPNE